MFRSAAAIQTEAAERKMANLREDWQRTATTWFDGTPESVERRIAKLDQILALASESAQLHGTRVGSFSLAALPNLKANRADLVALRRTLVGGSWFPGSEEDARGFNLDPRNYSSREEWMDASNMANYIQHVQEQHPAHDFPVSPHTERLMSPYQAAREFIEDQNTTDRHELLVRAQRLVEARTSSWSVEESTRAVRDFVAAVEGQIPHAARVASVEVPTHVADFEDHLMFS